MERCAVGRRIRVGRRRAQELAGGEGQDTRSKDRLLGGAIRAGREIISGKNIFPFPCNARRGRTIGYSHVESHGGTVCPFDID